MSAPSIAAATVDLVVDFAPMIRALREAADRLEAASSTSAPVEPVEEPEAEEPEPEVHYLRDRDGDVWEVRPDGSASWTHYANGAHRPHLSGTFRALANGIPTHLRPLGHPVRLTDQEVEALQ
jgi:hypothetical protein